MRILTGVLAWLALCFASLAHGQTGGGFPPAIKPIFCTAACSAASLKAGQALIISPSGTDTRTSNAAMTKSTIYDITNITAGNYRISGNWEWFNSGGVQGFRGNVQFGGVCNTSLPAVSTFFLGTVVKAGQNIVLATDLGLTAQSDNLMMYGFFVSFGGTEVNLCWAQNVSGATTTQINGNSYMMLEKLN
jgi:hypothetical protein